MVEIFEITKNIFRIFRVYGEVFFVRNIFLREKRMCNIIGKNSEIIFSYKFLFQKFDFIFEDEFISEIACSHRSKNRYIHKLSNRLKM